MGRYKRLVVRPFRYKPSGIKSLWRKHRGRSTEKPVQPNIPKSDFLAFTLTYDTPQNGTITVSSSTNSAIPTGSSISGSAVLTITATPNTGYNLASLKVNDTDFTSGNTYIVNSDVKVEATFSEIPKPEPEPDPNPEPGAGPGLSDNLLFCHAPASEKALRPIPKPANTR